MNDDANQSLIAGHFKPLLTTEDCARIAKVHPKTIRMWCQTGCWPDPVINQPHTKRWRTEDIERFLKTGRLR